MKQVTNTAVCLAILISAHSAQCMLRSTGLVGSYMQPQFRYQPARTVSGTTFVGTILVSMPLGIVYFRWLERFDQYVANKIDAYDNWKNDYITSQRKIKNDQLPIANVTPFINSRSVTKYPYKPSADPAEQIRRELFAARRHELR